MQPVCEKCGENIDLFECKVDKICGYATSLCRRCGNMWEEYIRGLDIWNEFVKVSNILRYHEITNCQKLTEVEYIQFSDKLNDLNLKLYELAKKWVLEDKCDD